LTKPSPHVKGQFGIGCFDLFFDIVNRYLADLARAFNFLSKGIFMKKWIALAMVATLLSGCSFAPVVAQKMGIGTSSDEDIAQATSKVFGVPATSIKVTDIQKDNGFNGTQIFYAANVQGKNYRCGMLSSFAGASLPKCVKPGEPLSLQ
jgi:hypothetical protein